LFANNFIFIRRDRRNRIKRKRVHKSVKLKNSFIRAALKKLVRLLFLIFPRFFRNPEAEVFAEHQARLRFNGRD
jgi:hypothetical protein